jgi:hypothetical protein
MTNIKQGQKKVHKATVPSGTTALTLKLNWGNTQSKLSLSPYDPAGHILRTYSDNDDLGGVDGKINLKISSQDGMESGVWRFKVKGVSVHGREDYTFKVYAHH